MKIPLNRVEFVTKKLGILNGDKVLDIGCRDMILKNFLKGDFQYVGLDYSEKKQISSYIINHNLEQGFPENFKNTDIIIALDVLEHIENIHTVYRQLFDISNKMIVVALPNMAYYKFRLQFLTSGILSGKYIFSEDKVLDRHRWIPNYKSIDKFIQFNTPKNWKIIKYDYIAERKRNYLFYFLEKLFSKIFPNLFVYERVYFLKKL